MLCHIATSGCKARLNKGRTMGFTIYLKTVCPKCDALLRWLLSKGVTDFEFVNVEHNAEARAEVKSLGYMEAPVVISDDGDHWSGFRPDKVDELIIARREAGIELEPIPMSEVNQLIKQIKSAHPAARTLQDVLQAA